MAGPFRSRTADGPATARGVWSIGEGVILAMPGKVPQVRKLGGRRLRAAEAGDRAG